MNNALAKYLTNICKDKFIKININKTNSKYGLYTHLLNNSYDLIITNIGVDNGGIEAIFKIRKDCIKLLLL